MNPLIIELGITLALGLVLGGVIGFKVNPSLKKTKALEEKLAKMQEEQDAYKQKVTDHFQSTAGHFQDLAKRYRVIYTHMAEGAQELCQDTRSSSSLLELIPEKTVSE